MEIRIENGGAGEKKKTKKLRKGSQRYESLPLSIELSSVADEVA